MTEQRGVRHTVVVSDVHLCEGVDSAQDPLWLRWRHRENFPDADFAALVDRVLEVSQAHGDTVELVFNGDMFDFDAPPVIDGDATVDDLPRTESVAVRQIARILDDHPGYTAALGRILDGGHRVVFISGNHDPQMHFRGVQTILRQRLGEASGDVSLARNVLFRTWFHRTSDGVHIEHGNQYDPLCAFRYPMLPEHPTFAGDPSERSIQPTVGSLAFRHLISHMGYFNPHVDATWMLDLPGYVSHWARYYCFSPRSLATLWVTGAVRILASLVSHRDPGDPQRMAANITLAAQETFSDPASVARHAALCAPPAEDSLLRVAREFWLDRAVLSGATAAAVAANFWVPRRLGLPLAMAVPILAAAYELATPKPTLAETYDHIASVGQGIAEIYHARAVLFGHTHIPYGRWNDGVFYGNSGTWSAAFTDAACRVPVDPLGKPVLWLRGDGDALEGGLYRLRDGDLRPDATRDPTVSTSVPSVVAPAMDGAA